MLGKRQAGLSMLGVAVGALYFAMPFRVGVVCGQSMSPSLQNGQVYLIDEGKEAKSNIKPGDVVVFTHNNARYIKRVIAGPGDRVKLVRQQGIDDMLVMDWQLKFLEYTQTSKFFNTGKLVNRIVPEDHFYVVGDNLDQSVDSRNFGPIPADSVIGKMVFAPKPQARLYRVAGHADFKGGI